MRMPFRLRLIKRSQQYNVSNKDLYVIAIELLTKEVIECTLFSTSLGQECIVNVCQKLNLQQVELFGLAFKAKRGIFQWVDLVKPLKKQLDKYAAEMRLHLRLQRFVPNVQMLWDDVTRYHYFLQMKNFIIDSRYLCNRDEAILLASFSLQAEFGDFNPERHTHDYLVNFSLLPRTMISSCSKEVYDMLIDFVMNSYRNLQGVPQNIAEIYYISESQQLEGVGHEGFPSKDMDSEAEVCLGVSLRGIFVVHLNTHLTEHFLWTDIANLIHQKKVFTIEKNSDSVKKNYLTYDNDFAKCLWRTCVEQHQYFMKSVRNGSDEDQLDPDKTSSYLRDSLSTIPRSSLSMPENRLSINHLDTHSLNGSSLPHLSHSTLTELGTANQLKFHQREFSLPPAMRNSFNTTTATTTPSTLTSPQLSAASASASMASNDHQIYSNIDHHSVHSPKTISRARSSNDIVDLNQIQITFSSPNNISSDSQLLKQPEHSSLTNITTVQIHQQPSWAVTDHQKQICHADILTYEQRKALLPPYRPPPDYDTFMRQKYGNLI